MEWDDILIYFHTTHVEIQAGMTESWLMDSVQQVSMFEGVGCGVGRRRSHRAAPFRT